jgi:uncharacterized damage-inducible protein DinB
MITTEQLSEALARNVQIIRMQCEGLSHEQTLLQPPFRGNCLNWVLGHIAVHRDRILQVLGSEPVLGEAQATRYGHGSSPVTSDDEDVLRLEALLDVLDRGQERIASVLRTATPDDLARPVLHRDRPTTVAQRIFFLYFHDSYHTGQTELLRQLAGTNDQII